MRLWCNLPPSRPTTIKRPRPLGPHWRPLGMPWIGEFPHTVMSALALKADMSRATQGIREGWPGQSWRCGRRHLAMRPPHVPQRWNSRCEYLALWPRSQKLVVLKKIALGSQMATAKVDFRTRSCPLYPRKQTCAVQLGMSALGQKRTFRV